MWRVRRRGVRDWLRGGEGIGRPHCELSRRKEIAAVGVPLGMRLSVVRQLGHAILAITGAGCSRGAWELGLELP